MYDIFVVTLILLAIAGIVHRHLYPPKCSKAKLLEARVAGWRDCENMIIERAKKHGYDRDKFLKDILQ